MKKIAVRVLAVFLYYVLPILALTGQEKPAVIEADDPLLGTWVNSDYDVRIFENIAKIIISADGIKLDYLKISDTGPLSKTILTIEETWTDTDGNRWYKIQALTVEYPFPLEEPFKRYILAKVNEAGNIYEHLSADDMYPKDMNDLQAEPGHVSRSHGIWYKQQLAQEGSEKQSQEELGQPPGEDAYESGYLDGQRDGTGNKNWLISGLFLGPIGVMLPWVFGTKVPGGNLIGRSPEYVEGYTKGYKNQAGAENFLYSMKGCGIFTGVALTIGAGYYIYNETNGGDPANCMAGAIDAVFGDAVRKACSQLLR
jgi:hypothetical protein